MLDQLDKIMKYEDGAMTEPEMIEFFQGLVDTGLAWELQGRYGRTARDLILAGLVKLHTKGIEQRVVPK